MTITDFILLKLGKNKQLRKDLYRTFGIVPHKIKPYTEAFTHASSYNKKTNNLVKYPNNERLEFLGDAILDSIIAHELFSRYPAKGEGFLTETRSKIVSREQLSSLGRKMGVLKILNFSQHSGNAKPALNQMAGNALEAFIGAIYVDRGYDYTFKYIKKQFLGNYLNVEDLISQELSFKSKIFKWAQKEKKVLKFNTKSVEKINGRNIYEMELKIDRKKISSANNGSKKRAEEECSRRACEALGL